MVNKAPWLASNVAGEVLVRRAEILAQNAKTMIVDGRWEAAGAYAALGSQLMLLSATSQLRFLNAAGGTIFTFTNTFPYNQWMRVEGMVLAGRRALADWRRAS
jgi:hypothetical protein